MAATALRPQSNFACFADTPHEAAYTTPVANGSITRLYPLSAPVTPTIVKARVYDDTQIKGHEFAMDTAQMTTTAADITVPLSFPASIETVGFFFANALGAVSTSGGGDPYTHTITAQNGATSDQLPSTSFIIGTRGQTTTYKKYIGCVPNDVKFTCDNRGRAGLTVNYFTDGSETDASSFSIPSQVVATNPLWGKNATVSIDNSGSGPTDVSTLLRSFDITWNNNLSREDNRGQIAAGTTLTGLRFGTRTLDVSFKLWGSIADSYYATDFATDVLKTVIFKITNGTHSAQFSFSRCIFEDIKASWDNIRNITEFKLKTFVITANTGISPITMAVVSPIASYA